MGKVYLGRDPALKRLVVVKVLLPELAHDASLRARFAREAESAAAVSHPNVVSIFEVGELPRSGTAYFVMQFVDGPTLAQAFPPGQAVPESRSRRVLGEVASALAAAHARGLIHRDIKPSNIMLEHDTGRAVVLDFGISAVLATTTVSGERLTTQGTSLGTPEYMSPEQAAAEDVTEKSDVYSLGVLGFELLTGALPFSGGTPMALAAAHIKDPPPALRTRRADLDPQLADLIDRCLRKDPKARPAAADIARTLLLASPVTVEWPPPGLERLVGQGRVAQRLVVALALLVAAAMVWMGTAGSVAWYRDRYGSLDPLHVDTSLPIGDAWSWVVPPVLTLATFALLVGIVYTASSLAAALRWARAGGYPWDTLFDVAMDRGPDTGHLLSGTGPYGLMDAEARAGFLRNRRRGAVAQLLGLLALLPAALLLSLGRLPEPADPNMLVSPVQLAALAAFPFLGWLCSELLRLGEARIRQRQERGRLPRMRRPPILSELVSAWLNSVRHPTPRRPGWSALNVPVLVMLGACLVVSAALVTPAALAGSGSLYRQWVLGDGRGQRDGIELLREVQRTSAGGGRRRLDSLLGVAGRIPAGGAAARAAADTLMLLAIEHQHPDTVWLGNDEDRAATLRAYPLVARSRADTALWRLVPGRLTEQQRGALAADTLTPRLGLWRRFARADSLAPLWMVRPGFGTWDGNPGTLTDDRTITWYRATILDLAHRNMAAAVLAADRDDFATARLRVAENIAAARHFSALPVLGMRSLLDMARASLRELGRVSRDSALQHLAAALDEATPPPRWWWFGEEALMADPVDPPGMRVIADSLAWPATRWNMIQAVVPGACANTREVVFGSSARRHALLERIRQAAADIPRTDEWVAVQRRRLERLDRAGPFGRISGCGRAWR